MFEDAYRTKLAMILIDDVERLLEYANINNSVKFSNMVLQALLVLLKRRPPSDCRLMVVVTTSVLHQMELLQLDTAFYSIVHLPQLTEPEEFKCVLQYAAGGIKKAVVDEISRRFVAARVVCGLGKIVGLSFLLTLVLAVWLRSIKHPMSVKSLLNALETSKQECGKDDAALTVRAFLSALALTPQDDYDTSMYAGRGSGGGGDGDDEDGLP